MKRKLTTLIFILFLMAVPVNCLAFQNEPNGFRDLYWGETLQEVQKNYTTTYLSYNSAYNSVTYTVPLIDKNIGGIYCNDAKIYLDFWNNQLYSIYFYFYESSLNSSNEVYRKLLNSMIVHYGIPSTEQKSTFYDYGIAVNFKTTQWRGKTTTINLIQYLTPTTTTHEFMITISIISNNLIGLAYEDGTSRGW